MTPTFEPLLSDADAGKLLGLHPKTVQRLARLGELPAVRLGRYWRYRASTLNQWIEDHQTGVQDVTSFEQFFSELGTRPKGMTLDRINNAGHYAPGNVRWATPQVQRQNQGMVRLHCQPVCVGTERTQ